MPHHACRLVPIAGAGHGNDRRALLLIATHIKISVIEGRPSFWGPDSGEQSSTPTTPSFKVDPNTAEFEDRTVV